ncbi:cytochrome biogenesis protein CcdA [Caballeronia peredens]|nr:cytochrome biogenesis protein CcdA [Caballeronia peredens]
MLKAHAAGLGALLGVVSLPSHAAGSAYDIGTPVDPKTISAWNIDIDSNGRGLPAGFGDVAHGKQIFNAKCASCHGANGEGGIGDALVGGAGTLAGAKPKKTIGSYWPYPTTLFDYIRRAMPYNAPQSLSSDEVYALSAYLLYLNHIVPEDTRLDAQSLPKVKMPNREGFVSDPRPGKL